MDSRRYHARCNHCHGPDGVGSTFGPSLVEGPSTHSDASYATAKATELQ
jgi:mono/diheme cytochrome c family protein